MDGKNQPTVNAHWKKALRGRDSQELFVLAEQVDDLIASPGFVAVQELISEGREFALRLLTQGPTLTEATQYARQVGYIAGLEELAAAATAITEVAAERRAELEKRADGSPQEESP